MKKGFKFLGVMIAVLLTTGCVKMEIGMDINKDKSMNLVITEAFNNSLLEQSEQEIFSADQVKEIEKQGFKAKEYADDSMSGYTFTKVIENIDTVSSDKEVTGNIGIGLNSSEESSDQLFTVKKGFFKNTYTAKLTSSDSKEIEGQINPSENTINDTTTYDNPTTDNSTSINNNVDYSAMMSSMNMNFTVNLPYKAKSNNATSVENDGKKLVWNLLSFKEENVKFEFELYNMTNIYITAGIGTLLLIILIVAIISKRKNKKKPIAPTIQNNEPKNENIKPTAISQTPIMNAQTTSMPSVQSTITAPEDPKPTIASVAPNVIVEPATNPQISNTQIIQNTNTQAMPKNSQVAEPINYDDTIETLDITPTSIGEPSNLQSLAKSPEKTVESLDIFSTLPDDLKQDK